MSWGLTDTHTHTQNPTTVTLAAHARRGLIIMVSVSFLSCRMGDQISILSGNHTDSISVIDKHKLSMKSRTQHQALMTNAIIPALLLTIAFRILSGCTDGLPYIAVSLTNKKVDDLLIPNDQDLILWSLMEQRIYWKGKIYCKTQIVCSSGCDVEISWSMKRMNIKLWVRSMDGQVQTDEIPVEKLDCDKLWPMFGAISVGMKPIEIELLNKVVQPSELSDVTQSVKFCSAGGELTISSDGKQVSRSSENIGNSVAVIDKVLRDGIHYWKIEVISDFGASIAMGLATYNFEVSSRYCNDHLKHIYHHKGLYLWRSYRGFLYQHGRQLTDSIEPLGWQNDCPVIVEFTLNMNDGTLEIFKNGKSLGIAFKDIRGPVQPAVAFYAAYEKAVRLLSFRSSGNIEKGIVEPDSVVAKKDEPDEPSFDPQSTSSKGGLVLSDNNMSLCRKREHSGNAYCLLNRSLEKVGLYRWSFVIQNDQGASTCIGVAREPIRLNKTGNIYTSQDLYVFRSFQGMLYSEGKELKKRFMEFWLGGSLVEVSFEVQSDKKGVLQYSVNGEDQGIAFTNISTPVRPIVGFYAGMEKKVTLVHFEQKSSKMSKLKYDENDINTDRTNASSKQSPLPIFIHPSEISMYYETCMICGEKVDTIALPCKHSTLCANHLVFDGSQKCLICDQTISGVWNLLLL